MAHNLNEVQRNILIDLIRQRRFLYDTSHPNYRNVSGKRRAWKDLAKICKAPENSIKIFWKSMRDQYQRYMRSPANKKKKFRYLSQLSFLEGFTKNSKKNITHCNDNVTDFFVDSSNSSNNQISYKEESDDYGDYSEEFTEKQIHLTDEYDNDNEECEHEEITSEPVQKLTTSQSVDDPIYCNNNYTHEVATKNNEEVEVVDKSVNNLCGTINSLLAKHFQTEEDDNDLFLKMIGKKMKSLPLTVKNRLQEHFLQEVNNEIQKLNKNTS